MGQAARKMPLGAQALAVFGLEEGIASSFRQAARERAPGLAAAYGRLWRRVSGRVGRAPWPAPWPQDSAFALSWRRAGSLALQALRRLDMPLARRAGSVWLRGRVRPDLTLAAGQWSIQCRPQGASVRIGFDGSLMAAAALAQALWLAGHVTLGWLGPSAPLPSRAAGELGGAMARLTFAQVLGETHIEGAQRLMVEADLINLVRMPTLDLALDLVGKGQEALLAWNEAASLFAPALAWTEAKSPLDCERQGAPLALAIGHASALCGLQGARGGEALQEMFTEWGSKGPRISLQHFAALRGFPLDSVAGWRGAYDLAEESMARMERAR